MTSRTALGGNDMRPGEENDGASFLSACRAALLDVAAVLAAVLLVSATGVGIAFAAFVLMFMSL